jgi:hypothetical protein
VHIRYPPRSVVRMDRRYRTGGNPLAPDGVREPVERNHGVSLDEELGKNCPLLLAAQRRRLAESLHSKRAEQPNTDLTEIPGSRCSGHRPTRVHWSPIR